MLGFRQFSLRGREAVSGEFKSGDVYEYRWASKTLVGSTEYGTNMQRAAFDKAFWEDLNDGGGVRQDLKGRCVTLVYMGHDGDSGGLKIAGKLVKPSTWRKLFGVDKKGGPTFECVCMLGCWGADQADSWKELTPSFYGSDEPTG